MGNEDNFDEEEVQSQTIQVGRWMEKSICSMCAKGLFCHTLYTQQASQSFFL